MKDEIDKMMLYLPLLTKEEADFIQMVIEWDSDKKSAFILSKRIFENDAYIDM